jgi:hypothetical protein
MEASLKIDFAKVTECSPVATASRRVRIDHMSTSSLEGLNYNLRNNYPVTVMDLVRDAIATTI